MKLLFISMMIGSLIGAFLMILLGAQYETVGYGVNPLFAAPLGTGSLISGYWASCRLSTEEGI